MPRITSRHWGEGINQEQTRPPVDPFVRLGCAVVKHAVVELQDKDLLEALPALCWWLEEGPDWLTMLDVHTLDNYLERLIEDCTNGKKQKHKTR